MLYYEYKMKRWEVVKMEFLETKKVIEEMMQKDYKIFVTALISIEKDITNQEVLDMMCQKYMYKRQSKNVQKWEFKNVQFYSLNISFKR